MRLLLKRWGICCREEHVAGRHGSIRILDSGQVEEEGPV